MTSLFSCKFPLFRRQNDVQTPLAKTTILLCSSHLQDKTKACRSSGATHGSRNAQALGQAALSRARMCRETLGKNSKKTSKSRTLMGGFSMIELVFVIVILGVLASIAIPRLSLTRSDAQYTAVLADIQSALNSIQQKFITQDLDPNALNGAFIMQAAGLSYARWIPDGAGVRLAKNNAVDAQNNCVFLRFENMHLKLIVDRSVASPLCQKLSKQYPSPVDIPLESSAIKF
ncbi:type II secretion system protein [Helicobacter mustelae]|uniref:type II secretion system protein n=1 Tax=Helicobacter mustelae TaxID=217 RepID=UPI0003231DB2|nr:type II secretion system protein [Helicobacter mustelae]